MNEEHEFNIRQIQRALRILHKNGEDIPVVFEDGVFGEETENAIIAFQKLSKLPANGIVDKLTWNSLVNNYNKHGTQNQ